MEDCLMQFGSFNFDIISRYLTYLAPLVTPDPPEIDLYGVFFDLIWELPLYPLTLVGIMTVLMLDTHSISPGLDYLQIHYCLTHYLPLY
jgi:hypothetical protein